MTTISVIIANYNRAGLIGETLQNMLRQSRPAEELIVVDDGSTDDSVAVIESFGNKVKLLRQTNQGPGAARNRGLAASTGVFIQFFDSDDLCSLNKLEVQARALEETGADIAYGPWLQAFLEDGEARHPEKALQQRPLPPGRTPLSWFLRGWVTVFQCCMVRRSLLERVGPYREDLFVVEDSELLFRMLRAAPRLVHTPEALVLYRLHDAQISRGDAARMRQTENLVKLAETIADQIDRDSSGVSRGDRAYWQRRVWQAHRELHELSPQAHAGQAVVWPLGVWYEWCKFQKRVTAGISRRTAGTSFSRAYGPGQMILSQEELIRTLGYSPVQGPRVL